MYGGVTQFETKQMEMERLLRQAEARRMHCPKHPLAPGGPIAAVLTRLHWPAVQRWAWIALRSSRPLEGRRPAAAVRGRDDGLSMPAAPD